MFRFTIRDLLWLMVVVGLGVGWWIDRSNAKEATLKAVSHIARQWAMEVNHPVSFTTPGDERETWVVRPTQ
jgi:hypothetical protein